MFRKFANHLQSHPLQRHLLILGAALLAILVNGYHFGTFDQVFHITYLKKFMDPSLYLNDPLLTLRWYHFSYFWFPFIILFQAEILEISMFIIHIITVYGTIWMFWSLSNLLFKNAQANLLIIIALIFPHIGLPGFQIIEFSLLNRTFVLPFLLGTLWLYLKGRKVLAFLILGLMFNLHVIYAVFVLCMLLVNEVLTFKLNYWYQPTILIITFLLAGLPVLIWRIQTGSGIDFSLEPEMLDLAARSMLYTVYFPIGFSSQSIGNLLAGLGTLWAFILGYRHVPQTNTHLAVRNFNLAIGILVLVGGLTSYFLPVAIILQMQIVRAGVFMLYFGMLYLCYFICHQRENGSLNSIGFIILSLSFVLLITPLITILLWQLVRHVRMTTTKGVWLTALVLGFQGLIIIFALQSGLWAPGFHIYGPKSPWRDAQEWARMSTPTNSIFISPPHIFGHYTPDWRVFSERVAIATIPEMMEIPFDPDFTENLQHRFEAVAPGAIESFNGDYTQTIKITKQAFYSNTNKDLLALICQFSADYLVVEQGYHYNFDLIYENKDYLVYKLPPCTAPLLPVEK